TGATTATLLGELPADRTRYVFTNPTDDLFPRARKRFAAHDIVDYRPLDLNRDPAEQGFAPGSFDLVVAGETLHGIPDLPTALPRIRRLLAGDGQLLMLESQDSLARAPHLLLLDAFRLLNT